MGKKLSDYYEYDNKERNVSDVVQAASNVITSIKQEDQLLKNTKERYKLSSDDKIDEFLRENYQDELSKEYLVDGAILTCTNCTNKPVMYNIGGKAYMFLAEQSKDVNINEIDTYMYDNSKIYGRLKVSENTNASVEGLAYATIADSEKENNKNIPFFGNCLREPDSEEEKNYIQENYETIENKKGTKGNCKYLMKLNEEWDNYITDDTIFSFIDDKQGEVPGITMTSILFCKHGGFIYPVTSGQSMVTIEAYVTMDQLNALQWHNVTPWMVAELNRILSKYDITTTERIRHFLAQCMQETNRGACLREGAYQSWASQEAYEKEYNAKAYGYLYRGSGYIQLTWDYSYLAFATYMIKEECGIADIDWKSPANTGTGFEERYLDAVKKAEAAGMNIDAFKKIVTEGADYVAEEFAWEAAGYAWYEKDVNSVVDSLEPGNKNEADAVTEIINKYTSKKSYDNRRNYYEETTTVIE